jgi:hypothetical protein
MDTELLLLPVSVGEALDKLSILDIKLNNIHDERKKNVKIEYDLLLEKLNPFLNKTQKYYDMLKKTNKYIWELMDLLRDGVNIDNQEYVILCKNTIIANDVRFRIKNKINILSNSHIKEQKGYKVTKILFDLTNYEDDINLLLKSLTYYSILYDELHLKTSNEKIINYINKNINDIIFKTENDLSYKNIFVFEQFYQNEANIYNFLSIQNDIDNFI